MFLFPYIRSFPLHPNNKYKAKQMRKSVTFLRSVREGKIQDNCVPQDWKDGQVNTGNWLTKAETHPWETTMRMSVGEENLNY